MIFLGEETTDSRESGGKQQSNIEHRTSNVEV
jgi:hypothetical protein